MKQTFILLFFIQLIAAIVAMIAVDEWHTPLLTFTLMWVIPGAVLGSLHWWSSAFYRKPR